MPASTSLSGASKVRSGALVVLVTEKAVTPNNAKLVLDRLVADGGDPARIVTAEGLGAMAGGGDALDPIVEAALAANADAAEKIKDGNVKAIGAIIGHVMRETKGRADGAEVTHLLHDRVTRRRWGAPIFRRVCDYERAGGMGMHADSERTNGRRTVEIGPRMTRRRVLALGAGAGLAGVTAGLPGAWGATGGRGGRVVEPFTLGVASGDPLPDGVVLWTRLAPEPLQGGGMPNRPVAVRWEVAEDERFRRVAAKGTVHAQPESAHAVHVEVEGLRPGREYFYRFKTGPELSPIGRTKTAPAADQDPRRLTFAFASCQMYEHGYFTAYKHMAQEDLDLVVHLGDYIYEYAPNVYVGRSGNVRLHIGREIESLDDYRTRHAQYKTDLDLQAAHEAFPWIVTFDDHEVDNNWAADVPENTGGPNATRESFLARRAAAFQAFYEHMPLRRGARPVGPDMLAYRRLTFGRMAEFSALDTRQYRSDQACGDGARVDCAARLDPSRTMTGPDQERWLLDGLEQSRARWNVVAQQVFMAQRDFDAGPPQRFSMDAWDGYKAGRDRLLAHVQSRRVPNPVVLTGDVHRTWVGDLKADFDDPASATIGSEFVGSSISSTGDGTTDRQDAVLAANPHLKFYEDQRGYMRCELDAERWRTDVRVVPFVSRPGAPVTTSASFAVINGAAGVQPA